MKRKLKQAINRMNSEIISILEGNIKSIYLYGSITLNDFKFGWSDIDVLVLTNKALDETTAKQLITLRQDLTNKYCNNKYFRSFEGAILSLNGFINQTPENVVYWGTKGQKLKETYALDSFSLKEITEHGILLYGEEIKDKFTKPTFADIKKDITHHYETIRKHAQKTGRNLYSFGWFLDISRCLYTLKTGEIISKTKAGKWALKHILCPDKKALKIALKVRKKPLKYKNNNLTMNYAETLGESVQKYADVLENYLK